MAVQLLLHVHTSVRFNLLHRSQNQFFIENIFKYIFIESSSIAQPISFLNNYLDLTTTLPSTEYLTRLSNSILVLKNAEAQHVRISGLLFRLSRCSCINCCCCCHQFQIVHAQSYRSVFPLPRVFLELNPPPPNRSVKALTCKGFRFHVEIKRQFMRTLEKIQNKDDPNLFPFTIPVSMLPFVPPTLYSGISRHLRSLFSLSTSVSFLLLLYNLMSSYHQFICILVVQFSFFFSLSFFRIFFHRVLNPKSLFQHRLRTTQRCPPN